MVLGWLGGLTAQTPAPGGAAPAAPTDQKDQRPSDFARFVRDGDGGHFDTAITTYRNADGVEVQLFAAVHIADGACYAELQRRFQSCDALLYELVGPSDYRPKKGDARGTSFVSLLQQGMKSGLELEFQLDGIDYTAANFVHADMTGKEFEESMAERGETLFGMLWQLGLQAQAQLMNASKDGADAPKASELDLVRAFRSGEGRHSMRLLMASQLEVMESASAGGEGSTLLEGRNEKCLQVLQEQIAAGKRKLGIYYGGAHLTHMEHRLCDDLGFHKVDHEWIVAWDCTKRPDPKVDRELWRQRRQAKAELAGLAAAAARWRLAHAGATPALAQLTSVKDGPAVWDGAPQDPWGHDYRIAGTSTCAEARSVGPDGVADTADDLVVRSSLDGTGGEPVTGIAAMLRDAASRDKLAQAERDLEYLLDSARQFRLATGQVPSIAAMSTPDAKGRKFLDREMLDPWGHGYEVRVLTERRLEVRCAAYDGVMDSADDIARTR